MIIKQVAFICIYLKGRRRVEKIKPIFLCFVLPSTFGHKKTRKSWGRRLVSHSARGWGTCSFSVEIFFFLLFHLFGRLIYLCFLIRISPRGKQIGARLTLHVSPFPTHILCGTHLQFSWFLSNIFLALH